MLPFFAHRSLNVCLAALLHAKKSGGKYHCNDIRVLGVRVLDSVPYGSLESWLLMLQISSEGWKPKVPELSMIESFITEKIKELLPQESSRIPSFVHDNALGLESSENCGHPWPEAEGMLF
jgi:hypothetical protein